MHSSLPPYRLALIRALTPRARSLTDKAPVFGTGNGGSIPSGRTTAKTTYSCGFFRGYIAWQEIEQVTRKALHFPK